MKKNSGMKNSRTHRSAGIILAILALLLIVLAMVSANIGALNLSFITLWQIPTDDYRWDIWLNIRLPRVCLAMLVGCALAVSGSIMQGLFRNPLADPSLLGISSGASLAVALIIVLPMVLPPILALYCHMLAAFAGSLIICIIIYLLSRNQHGTLSRLLLAGVALNALCGSAIGVISYIGDDQQLRQFTLWSAGNLGQAEWLTIAISSSLIIPAVIYSLFLSHQLNILQLGDEEAHYLGLNVSRVKQQLLFLSALLVGVSVAVSGIIGFIGLVIPHLVRMRIGADHRWLLSGSILAGAALLLMADTLARTLFIPAEIPVGLLTSLLGGPYFLWLILRQMGGKYA